MGIILKVSLIKEPINKNKYILIFQLKIRINFLKIFKRSNHFYKIAILINF